MVNTKEKVNNMIAHFFDLDYTLWKTSARTWIIDKNNPDNYIIRINSNEDQLLTTGYYKNDNLPIYYNGIKAWLSKTLYDKILKKKPNIILDNIGISHREYSDAQLIENQTKDFILYIHNIKHLNNQTIHILTARPSMDNHKNLIDELKLSLNAFNIEIGKQYFVNDNKYIDVNGSSAERKCLILLQHLIGYKIEGNEFVPILVDKYEDIQFYDDDDLNVIACQNINKYFNNILTQTPDWLVEKITNRVNLNDLKLTINQVTSNIINPFIQQTIKIKI